MKVAAHAWVLTTHAMHLNIPRGLRPDFLDHGAMAVKPVVTLLRKQTKKSTNNCQVKPKKNKEGQ